MRQAQDLDIYTKNTKARYQISRNLRKKPTQLLARRLLPSSQKKEDHRNPCRRNDRRAKMMGFEGGQKEGQAHP